MRAMTAWAADAHKKLSGKTSRENIFSRKLPGHFFEVKMTGDSLWITDQMRGADVAFRAAYLPGAEFRITRQEETEQGTKIHLASEAGNISVEINFPADHKGILRYTTTLVPKQDLSMPFMPRDIIFPARSGRAENSSGKIHIQQTGTRSGMIYFSMTVPKAGSVMYMQNLTGLNNYFEQTKTSGKDTVGGDWPELGFALPASKEPLKAGKRTIISDASVCFSPSVPAGENAIAKLYLQLLADVYRVMPRPVTKAHDWPTILEKGLNDLLNNAGCWSLNKGQQYFNAYLCDYNTPPEIMVQLAILLPLVDFMEWHKKEMPVKKTIIEGLPAFYSGELKTIQRWLPSEPEKLKGDEEHKKPFVMDSWYLHHPLLNLSRMALKGDASCKKLFLDSIDFTINVARHFKYEWPVFYDMKTLEVIKAETEPGKGGEKDVAGLYTHIMLQAYELTGERKYLLEAERAAKTLAGKGFELLYQANNTSFAAGALLKLWKLTRKNIYRDLSYLCIANVLKNVQLWDCDYGHGKNFTSFFALFPLSNAPYTAVYEEQEVFCAFHEYLKLAEGEEILPEIRMLLAEYIRYLIYRAVNYYPPTLPADMLPDKCKSGELAPQLWIALEDLQDGWEKSGQVGQEVYGAGNAFGILPRHYFIVPGQNFMLFTDYPTGKFQLRGNSATLQIKGDAGFTCKFAIINKGQKRLPKIEVMIAGYNEPLKGSKNETGNMEFDVPGNCKLMIKW